MYCHSSPLWNCLVSKFGHLVFHNYTLKLSPACLNWLIINRLMIIIKYIMWNGQKGFYLLVPHTSSRPHTPVHSSTVQCLSCFAYEEGFFSWSFTYSSLLLLSLSSLLSYCSSHSTVRTGPSFSDSPDTLQFRLRQEPLTEKQKAQAMHH